MRPTIYNVKKSDDAVWSQLRDEAEKAVAGDYIIAPIMRYFILDRKSLAESVAVRLVDLISSNILDEDMLIYTFTKIIASLTKDNHILAADLLTVLERDPATNRLLEPLLYYKGFHALQIYRIAHELWLRGRRDFAYYLQGRSSAVFQTDIHPAAKIGKGIFIDHATGIVVGETVVIDDDVSLLHEVTLGGTGKISGDRHPKIHQGVLVGAGAKVLGNISVGECSQIAANSVVLKNVAPHMTVAGVPAKVVGKTKTTNPASSMDQTFVFGDGEGI